MATTLKNKDSFYKIRTAKEFNDFALDLFRYQVGRIPIYRQYLDHIGIKGSSVSSVDKIPFLPIQFFKSHRVCSPDVQPDLIFRSSATTGNIPSSHFIENPDHYKTSIAKGFRLRFGDVEQFEFFALLPGYLDRPDASLVYMFNHLMELSRQDKKRFYLNDFHHMADDIASAKAQGKKIFLVGVTHALLAFADVGSLPKDIILCETGGMKGKGKELIREELHDLIYQKLGVKNIISEYGMTELFSQAWLGSHGRFECPPWMKILLRDVNDPFSPSPRATGAINVIDLANIESCSFIATDDLGRLHKDGTFEVLGRMDNSETRGCNLMF